MAAGYQWISGDDPYPYIAGSDPYLVNFIQIGDFGNVDERSWQLRYDYDFGALGLPGLSFMSRYVSGDNARARPTTARNGNATPTSATWCRAGR